MVLGFASPSLSSALTEGSTRSEFSESSEIWMARFEREDVPIISFPSRGDAGRKELIRILDDRTTLYKKIEEAAEESDWKDIAMFLDTGRWSGESKTDKLSPLKQATTEVTIVDPQNKSKVLSQQFPLHLAILRGAPFYVIGRLVGLHPLAVRCTDNEGMLPIHLALHHDASEDTVNYLLLEFSGSKDIKDKGGYTPIQYALKEQTKMHGKMMNLYIKRSINESALQASKEVVSNSKTESDRRPPGEVSINNGLRTEHEEGFAEQSTFSEEKLLSAENNVYTRRSGLVKRATSPNEKALSTMSTGSMKRTSLKVSTTPQEEKAQYAERTDSMQKQVPASRNPLESPLQSDSERVMTSSPINELTVQDQGRVTDLTLQALSPNEADQLPKQRQNVKRFETRPLASTEISHSGKSPNSSDEPTGCDLATPSNGSLASSRTEKSKIDASQEEQGNVTETKPLLKSEVVEERKQATGERRKLLTKAISLSRRSLRALKRPGGEQSTSTTRTKNGSTDLKKKTESSHDESEGRLEPTVVVTVSGKSQPCPPVLRIESGVGTVDSPGREAKEVDEDDAGTNHDSKKPEREETAARRKPFAAAASFSKRQLGRLKRKVDDEHRSTATKAKTGAPAEAPQATSLSCSNDETEMLHPSAQENVHTDRNQIKAHPDAANLQLIKPEQKTETHGHRQRLAAVAASLSRRSLRMLHRKVRREHAKQVKESSPGFAKASTAVHSEDKNITERTVSIVAPPCSATKPQVLR